MVRTRVGARPQIKDSGMPKNVRKRVREKERNQVLVQQQMSTDERKFSCHPRHHPRQTRGGLFHSLPSAAKISRATLKGFEPPPIREDCNCVLTTSIGHVILDATAPARPFFKV